MVLPESSMMPFLSFFFSVRALPAPLPLGAANARYFAFQEVSFCFLGERLSQPSGDLTNCSRLFHERVQLLLLTCFCHIAKYCHNVYCRRIDNICQGDKI